METRIVINLWGTFSVLGAAGADVTPKLVKCQALLALLATARDGKRTRIWLQSRLWSDRGKEQASGSLRQALAAIRKSLGEAGGIVTADRQRVSLDLSRVHLSAPEHGEEFLAGMDARDEEFEDWLRLERSHRETAAPDSLPLRSPLVAPQVRAHPAIVLSGTNTGGDAMGTVELFLVDCVARSLRENFAVRAYTHEVPPASAEALKVQITATLAARNQVFLAARCIEAGTTRLLWSGHQVVRIAGAFPFEDLNVLGWMNEIVAAIAEFLGRRQDQPDGRQHATHLGLAALRELFSMETERVAEADRMLIQAHETEPRAIFLAWRAQLRGIQMVERHAGGAEALREEGLALAHAALESEPANSSVLAAAANARLILDQDYVACDELSRQSVALNPSNPLGWWSRAFIFLYTDRAGEALQASERGLRLSRGSPYRYWWEMQVAVSACAAGRIGRALLAAERCSIFAPNFRAPQRYMIGLHASQGTLDRAEHWARKLKAQEPDFTPDRLISDPGYPSSLLRKFELVGLDNLKPLMERVADN